MVAHEPQDLFDQVYSVRVGAGVEITCLATVRENGVVRVAVGTRDRVVHMWVVEPDFNVVNLWTRTLPSTIPKSVYGLLDGRL